MLQRWILSIVLVAGAVTAWGCGTPEAGTPEGRAPQPEAALEAPGGRAADAWFTEITDEVGLDFVHQTGGTGELHHPEIMGSGAALFDADGDGDLDVYLVNAAFELGEARTPGGRTPINRLYVWQDGRLADVTAASGLGDAGYGMGVAVGDVDNDGREDVYVANFGRDRLYRNLGGSFEDVSERAGIEVGGWSSSVAFLDFDRDGWLDVYVSRYVAYDRAVKCYDFAGRHEYCGPTAFPGVTDVLLRNLGSSQLAFADVSREAGIAAVAAAGLGVVCQDFDGDGWVDVYVANDADLDLFMTHLEDESNTLYRNLGGDLGFEDDTVASGLAATSMPYTGFGIAAFDADLDGDLDLFVANGRVLRGKLIPNLLQPPWDDYAEPSRPTGAARGWG